MTSPVPAQLHAYYERGLERDRLAAGIGEVEFLRTCEIVGRVLPAAPAVVADVGGGPGRYAHWLAALGHRVRHRDVVPLHVEQVRTDDVTGTVESAVADARALDLPDGSCDVVLLLGPLYHLPERADRLRALREAARVGRPGAPVLAAAINRWAPRLDGLLTQRLYRADPGMHDLVARVEDDGLLVPLHEGAFNGFCHTPADLRVEVQEAGLLLEDLAGVEGLSFALPDLEERMADPTDRAVVLDSARAVERAPELVGLSPHLVVTARVPG